MKYKAIIILFLASVTYAGTVELIPGNSEYSDYLMNAKKSYEIVKDTIEFKNLKPFYNLDSSVLLYIIGREKEAKVCYIKPNDTVVINLKDIYVLESAKWIKKDIIYLKIWLGRIFWYELYWDTKNNKKKTIKLFLEKPGNQ